MLKGGDNTAKIIILYGQLQMEINPNLYKSLTYFFYDGILIRKKNFN